MLNLCKYVYEPAEDTWLALDAINRLCSSSNGARICMDIGTGTGILGLECISKCGSSYAVLSDLNPCAAYCARVNAEKLGVDAYADIVQCDSLSCLRCQPAIANIAIVYNTPYLPVEEYDIEALAWSGGLCEALRAAGYAVNCIVKGCIVLVYSSLSGDDSSIIKAFMDSGFQVERIVRHVFFEDIKVVKACKK